MPHDTLLGRLHGLRALAALAVVAHRLAEWDRDAPGSAILPPGPILGWVGVDLFFVLSGFIIVYAAREARRGPAGAAGFLLARAGRIYPAYWAVTLAVALIAAAAPGLARETAGAPLLESLLLSPAIKQPFLGPGWTLQHEIFFYAIMAVFMLAPARWLAALLAIWVAFTAGAALAVAPEPGTAARLFFNPLNLMFLMGAGIALTAQADATWRSAMWIALGLIGLAAGAAIVHVAPTLGGYGGEWLRLGLCGAPAAMLVLGLAQRDFGKPWVPPGIATRFGDWSYAIYLTSLPVLGVWSGLVAAPPTIEPAERLAVMAGTVATTVAVSAVLFTFIETPTRRGAKRMASRLAAALSPRVHSA